MSKTFSRWHRQHVQQHDAALAADMPPATVYAGDAGQSIQARRVRFEEYDNRDRRQQRRQRERERMADL